MVAQALPGRTKQLLLWATALLLGTCAAAEAPVGSCEARIPRPPVNGTLLPRAGDTAVWDFTPLGEDVPPGCGYKVWEIEEISHCLEGVWVVITGGSAAAIWAVQLINSLAPGTLIDSKGNFSINGPAALVVDVVIDGRKATHKAVTGNSGGVGAAYAQVSSRGQWGEATSPRRLTRITYFRAEWWDEVTRAIDIVNGTADWSEAEVAAIITIGGELTQRMALEGEAAVQRLRGGLTPALDRLEEFCSYDGSSGNRGCTLMNFEPCSASGISGKERLQAAIADLLKPWVSSSRSFIDLDTLSAAVPQPYRCAGRHPSPVTVLWTWQVLLAGICNRLGASPRTEIELFGPMCKPQDAVAGCRGFSSAWDCFLSKGELPCAVTASAGNHVRGGTRLSRITGGDELRPALQRTSRLVSLASIGVASLLVALTCVKCSCCAHYGKRGGAPMPNVNEGKIRGARARLNSSESDESEYGVAAPLLIAAPQPEEQEEWPDSPHSTSQWAAFTPKRPGPPPRQSAGPLRTLPPLPELPEDAGSPLKTKGTWQTGWVCSHGAASSSPTPHLSGIKVRPYGVLGEQLTRSGNRVRRAPEPGMQVAFFDPAGLPFIRAGPQGAGGAAGDIYDWLGIRNSPAFPDPVVRAIDRPLAAKFHAYGFKKCIHVVGPDFSEPDSAASYKQALGELARAYQAAFVEFIVSGERNLRMLPLSGGVYAGRFSSDLPRMTAEAIQWGFSMLEKEQQQLVQRAEQVELCIFLEKELAEFEEAFAEQAAADAARRLVPAGSDVEERRDAREK